MQYTLPALLRGRLVLPVLALGGLLLFLVFLSGDMWPWGRGLSDISHRPLGSRPGGNRCWMSNSQKAKAYFNSGFGKASHMKYEEAERDLRESILLYPDNAEAHYFLAFAIGNQRYQDNAMKELGRAVLLKPGYAGAYYFMGLWYAMRNQGDEFEAELREAIRLNPNYAEPLFILAGYLDRQQRRKEARPFWERALKVEKDTADFQYIWKRLEKPD